MTTLVDAHVLGRRFGAIQALTGVSFTLSEGSAIGLVGRNGSGKSTLLRLIAGLSVPTSGRCSTLGQDSRELGPEQLQRLGFVDQEAQLLPWLTVAQHIAYVAAMQPRWDSALARRLEQALELPSEQRVGTLSPGTRRRLAVLLALGHRPALLLLDEPLAGIDPTQRKVLLELFLERQLEDGTTLLTSSHQLVDIERTADRILCLEAGRLTVDAPLDELKERYAEWIVTNPARDLPARFDEPFILRREGQGRQARLTVRAGASEVAGFKSRHGVDLEARPLDLEQLFPWLLTNHQEQAR